MKYQDERVLLVGTLVRATGTGIIPLVSRTVFCADKKDADQHKQAERRECQVVKNHGY